MKLAMNENLVICSNILLRLLRKTVVLILGITLIVACTPVPPATAILDPNEAANRRTHEMNKKLDRALVGPASNAYGSVVPGFVLSGVGNFANNLALPGMVLNNALQLNLPDAVSNSFRFVMNTTVGIGGLVDVAGYNGLLEQSTDFGETLHIWGMPEGNYVELPILGPSTQRDAVGIVVDFFIDPLNYVLPAPRTYYKTGAKVLGKATDRHKYSDLINSVLYESEDSYAQSRLIYLQSRRRDLQGELTDFDLEDPYAE